MTAELTNGADGGAADDQRGHVAAGDEPRASDDPGEGVTVVGRRRRPTWLRNAVRILAAALTVFLVLTGVSIGSALTAPGTDSVAARLAEWARDHGMSRLVTWAENQQYQRNKPKVGGSLSSSEQAQLRDGLAPTAGNALDLPGAIAPIMHPALAGEGTWHVLVRDGKQPVVMRALLRPDQTHTSYLAYVAWIDSNKVRFVLHPGSAEPGGGPWTAANSIQPSQRTGLVATFNSAFRLKDALMGPHGGYYVDGRTVGQLRNGYAAFMIRRDGSMNVGMWGRDDSLRDPSIVAVRENLRMLVDNGRVQADAMDGSGQAWGFTIKNAYYVWRSGIGVTGNGDIVYAMGPTLSVQTLAQILQRAGAVRAMELDINPDWVSFMSYADPSSPTPAKLMNFTRPADRYFRPSSRDFVAAFLK